MVQWLQSECTPLLICSLDKQQNTNNINLWYKHPILANHSGLHYRKSCTVKLSKVMCIKSNCLNAHLHITYSLTKEIDWIELRSLSTPESPHYGLWCVILHDDSWLLSVGLRLVTVGIAVPGSRPHFQSRDWASPSRDWKTSELQNHGIGKTGIAIHTCDSDRYGEERQTRSSEKKTAYVTLRHFRFSHARSWVWPFCQWFAGKF